MMNDFDYDVMQKKRTARGAYNKKGGSKSKKCTLPSDYLTPAQKKALNGPCTEMNRNQPMGWKDFKVLSDTLKVEYIKYLQDNYHANWKMMGQMMKVSDVEMCKEGKRLGVKALPIVYDKKRRGEIAVAWEKFCNGPAEEQKEEPVEEQPVMELEAKTAYVVIGNNEPVPTVPLYAAELGERIEKMADRLDSIQDKLEQACTVTHEEPNGFDMEAAKHVTQTSRLDMIFQGWPDDTTMLILRNMFRDKNVKVRISAEVI